VFGLGGWFLGALVALRFLPSLSLDNELLAVVSIAVRSGSASMPAGSELIRQDNASHGIGIAGVAAVVGAVFGFHISSGSWL